MPTPPSRGPSGWRQFHQPAGIHWDERHPDSAWLRDRARLPLPAIDLGSVLVLRGEYRPDREASGLEAALPTLAVRSTGGGRVALDAPRPGPWELRVTVPRGKSAELRLALGGVAFTNFLAWIGRLTGIASLQRFRAQRGNRQLRLIAIETENGETVFDFSRRDAPFSADLYRRHFRPAMNIVGFLTADLGVGESARCMVRAADAAGIDTALVALRLPCKNRHGDPTYEARLGESNPHPVNVLHVDPPATRDLVHHHGRAFFAGRHNVGYFAWELPEFPDAWTPYLDFYNEIWCPSEFTRRAIEQKSPVPVIRMPHAISFDRPAMPQAELRARFGLPTGPFLFLVLFDFHSYAVRKNPAAALAAFRESGLGPPEAGLVVKVQNAAGSPADFRELQAAIADLPGATIIDRTLSRAETYGLQSACDCLVSLHRSEGFGLVVAECMYLGKPVISTNWSATAEFVAPENGCPVDFELVTLERSHGPYSRGGTWAQPSVGHAAEWMRRLAADRALSARLGAAARSSIETRFSPAAIGALYRRRLENIA